MVKFPAWVQGMDLSAQNLADGLPDMYVKASASTRVSNTYSNDSELSGIALEVGVFYIRAVLFYHCTGSATPDIKTTWTFTGTWNNPVRACFGPAATNTATRDLVTPSKYSGIPAATDAIYGLPASSGFMVASEESFDVTVTVAGNFAVAFAQNTTDAANATTLQVGSALTIWQRS